MSDAPIHVFRHSAMATEFQVRIAGEERTYAAQTAQAAFALLDELEINLSRFRANSEISRIAGLTPGASLRLTEPVFACLQIAQRMEFATHRAFSISPAALKSQPALPTWSLREDAFSIGCDCGRLEFDLGAIGKGFALDRMASLLREWDCPRFLLVAGGSSIVAGAPPPDKSGWSCGLGDDNSAPRLNLMNCSLSGSGLTFQGHHIFDPRTGLPATCRDCAWVLAPTAAESDALSTACMILKTAQILEMIQSHPDWLVFIKEQASWRQLGNQAIPADWLNHVN